MDNIKDLDVYLTRMDATLVDKCWWLSQLDENDHIDTVIDFGCASGALGELLNSIGYKKFRYIGIDNNPQMWDICFKKGIEVYKDLQIMLDATRGTPDHIDPEHTILVMNSVIHEILHYSCDLISVFHQINCIGFKYIAIRDMALKRNLFYPSTRALDKCIHAIAASPYKDNYDRYCKYAIENRAFGYTDMSIITLEFLLKYWYKENWERESKEQYLWYWEDYIAEDLSNYEIQHSKWYQIPFVVDKIKTDFNYVLEYPTHRKLLLRNISYPL